MKFREKGWTEFVTTGRAYSVEQLKMLYNGDKVGEPAGVKVIDFVMDQIEKTMIVKYGDAPSDAEIDPESQMDVESVIEELIDPK
jgi:hypothetical protein